MINTDNVLRNLYRGINGKSITRAEILRRITNKTFSNYSSLLQNAELVTVEKNDPKDSRKITKLILTKKGEDVIASEETGKVAPVTGVKEVTISGKLDLEEITRITDEFSRRNPSWEWKLVRRESKKTK